jgi:uncharacterized protein (TIGR02271 family)
MSSKRPSDDYSETERVESARIPVVEEKLKVGVRKEEIGKVRAVKKVHEEDLIVSGPVINQDVQVQRVPLNQYVDKAPRIRHEGNTMIIPVVREEVIVSTRLVLVEEVRITRRQVEETIEKPITIRKEEVVIERSSEGSLPDSERGL